MMNKLPIFLAASIFTTSANADLVSYWKMDGSSAAQSVTDSAGLSPGTLGSTVGIETEDPAAEQPGVFGTAYGFNAAEKDRITIPSHGAFAGLTTGSITGWFKDNNTDRGPIFSYRESSTNDRLVVELAVNGHLHYYLQEGGVLLSHFQTNARYDDGAWYHFALTQDGAGAKLYVNGSEITAFDFYDNTADWFNTLTNANALTIGYENRAAGEFSFSGSIDDLAVFDHALSEQQVANVIANGADGYAVPEPASMALIALAGLMLVRRRR